MGHGTLGDSDTFKDDAAAFDTSTVQSIVAEVNTLGLPVNVPIFQGRGVTPGAPLGRDKEAVPCSELIMGPLSVVA